MTWKLVDDGNGSPRVVLNDPAGSSAEVLLYGGQVISWKNDPKTEILFVSSKGDDIDCSSHEPNFASGRVYFASAILKPPKPFMGGMPIFFPQVGDMGPLDLHGFARNRVWILDNNPSTSEAPKTTSIDLLYKPTEDDLKIWPHSFELRLRVVLGPSRLTLIPRVKNVDKKHFTFTFALRNYLSVSDVSEVRIEGLETLDYLDNLSKRERYTEQADAITFEGQVDRVYLSTPKKINIIDHQMKRTVVLRKANLPDAVVWNPWDKKAKTMPDIGGDDYKLMVCLDSGAIEHAIHLKPGEEWIARQELSVVSSSYFSGQLDPEKVLKGLQRPEEVA